MRTWSVTDAQVSETTPTAPAGFRGAELTMMQDTVMTVADLLSVSFARLGSRGEMYVSGIQEDAPAG